MIVDIDRAAGVVTKRAETRDETDRLRREVDVLTIARHPGVVELLASGKGWLRVGGLGRGEVDLARLSRPALLELAAVLATTLADLHDLGTTFGNRLEGHVLLGNDEQPILCSPGRDRATTPAEDVAAVSRLLAPLLTPLPPALARAGLANPQRRPTARALARALATKPDGGRRRPWPPVTAGVAAAALAVCLLLALRRPGSGRLAARPGGMVATAAGRYRIGNPGDVVLEGRWSCSSVRLPALLRPASGEVWLFDRWAGAGEDVTARFVARVPGAATLRAGRGRPGCDRLLVTTRTRGTVPVLPN